MRRAPSSRLAVALTCVGLVVAAGLIYVAAPRESSVLQVRPGLVALVNKGSAFPGGPSNAAQISGTLTALDSGCLGLDGGEQAVLVFPYGTEARPQGDGVVALNGVVLLIGQQFTAGGGGRELSPQDNWVVEQWPAAAGACGEARSAQALHDITVVG